MDHQEIRTLKILEEIDKEGGEGVSQRHLARELNISLGLVNSFLKRLAHKGYFKITNIPANRVGYILTPQGAAEKSRLTYAYIKYSFGFYKNARQKLRVLLRDLVERGARRLVLYGASDLTEIAYLSLQEFPLELLGIVDEPKRGERFLGFEVAGSEALGSLEFDAVVITAIEAVAESLEDLARAGVSRERIVMLD